MRNVTLLLSLSFLALTIREAPAANPREILGTIVEEIGRQVERKQQKRQHRKLEALWNACFNGSISHCDRALATRGYSHVHRQRLAQQSALLLDQQQSLATRRLCLGAGDLEACNRLLASSHLSEHDRDAIIESLQDQTTAEVADEAAIPEPSKPHATLEKAITREADGIVVADVPKPKPVKLKLPASPVIAADSSTSLAASLPTSTLVASSVAALLALALGGLLMRFRHQLLPAPAGMPLPGPWSRSGSRHNMGMIDRPRASRDARAVAPWSAARADPPLGAMRDSDTALSALRLAMSYLAEVETQQGEAITDDSIRAEALNTLSLAARQLEIARQADPDAELVIEETSGEVHVLTQARLRSTALLLEGVCHVIIKPRKALAILERAAAIAPDDAHILSWIGNVNVDLLNRRRAVAAFARAVELEPGNIDYRKGLDRARNLSGAAAAVRRTADAASLVRTCVVWLLRGVLGFFVLMVVLAFATGDVAMGIGLLVGMGLWLGLYIWLKIWWFGIRLQVGNVLSWI